MKNLPLIVAGVEADLDEKDRVREGAFRSSRVIIRRAGGAIRAILRGEDPRKDLEAGRKDVRSLRTLVRRYPELLHGGPVETALQEVAEAEIVWSVVRERRLPPPKALGVTSAAYALGLADAIGEFRRLALDRMRTGRMKEAERFVGTMEDLLHTILRFGYPDAVVAIRHKQDVARSLVERTRGELSVAARSAELERKLEHLSRGR